MALSTMNVSWNNYYKDEAERKESGRLYEINRGPFDQFENDLIECRKGETKFQSIIERTEGTNLLLIPTTDKQVQVIHSLFTTKNPSDKGNKMTIGIQGLSKVASFLQIPERDLIKSLGRVKPVKTAEGDKGVLLIPSPKDFATVTSSEEFKKLIGTQPAKNESRLSELPNFTFFHPFLLVRTFYGQTMRAAQLGCQIIDVCSTSYGPNRDAPDDEGVTYGLRHSYDLLLFLWAVEKGLAKPIQLSPFIHSETSELLCAERLSKLEDWKTNTKLKEIKEETKYFDPENSSSQGKPSDDEDSKERAATSRKKRSKKPDDERKRSKSPSSVDGDTGFKRSKSPDSSTSSSSSNQDENTKKRTSKHKKTRLDSPDEPLSSELILKPHRKKVVMRSASRSRSRSFDRKPSPQPIKRKRSRTKDKKPLHRIRGGYEDRSPSPDRRRRPRRRHEHQGHRNRGNDHDDDDDSSSSDDDRRQGGGGRRGDEREPRHRRRRSPSSSDEEIGGRENRRGNRRERHRGGRDDRGNRRNSRDRSRSDSRESDRRQEYRRGRRRGARPRSRSPEVDPREFMASVTSAIQEATLKSDMKRSMIANLHSEAADHFKYLSARSYSERKPKLNHFTEKLMEDRNMNKALGYIASATRDWRGQVSRKGLTEFMTQGYAAMDINKGPGGFTVFMFSPRSYRQEQSEEEKRSAMKAAFGDTKIDDDMIKRYIKVDRFIANDFYEAEVQLEACVCFLEMLGAPDGISSEGYLTGLRYLRDHQQMFVEMTEADPAIIIKFLFMLDRIFQRFLSELSRYYHHRHPLRAARRELEGSMRKSVLDMMRGFELGSIPHLILPRALQAQGPRHPLGEVGKGGDPGKGGKRNPERDKDSTPRGKENPPWWSRNPNLQAAWCLPKGKEYKDFFSSVVKEHEGNIQGWPKLQHHRSETKSKKKPMCIRYQCTGSCRDSCLMAHVDPKDISKEDHVLITNKFKKIFGHYITSSLVPRDSPPTRIKKSVRFVPLDTTKRDNRNTEDARFVPQEGGDDPESDTEESPRKRVPRPLKRRVPRPEEKGVTRPSEENRKSKDRRRTHSENNKRSTRFGNSTRNHQTKITTDDSDEGTPSEDDEENTLDGLEIPKGVHPKQIKALGRNITRIRKANNEDRRTLSKYLPKDIKEVFNKVVKGADDSFVPPAWLMEAVREVADTPVSAPSKPPIVFDTTEEALNHNTNLLREFDFDFEKFLSHQTGSTLDYGSEFRPTEQLRKVLGNHPNYAFFDDVIQNGMQYHFVTPLTEDERKKELDEQIKRGNHKSAQAEAEVANRLLYKDVTHGFAMPIQASAVTRLKGAMVEPCGVANQFKLQSDGTRELAARLTHDLSYSITRDDASVNRRIDMEQYVEMVYGWCLTRTIHFIVALRLKYPNKKIFISKYDYSDAYRRVAHAASAAVQTILIVGKIAYIMLRLAFGGSPNPPTWCAFSEMVTDLSNEIDLCDEWDPEKLHSPVQKDTPTPKSLNDEIPFAKAQPLAVEVPVEVTARTDSFIDDLIRIFLDTPRNRKRSPHAVPLAIHVTSRPHAGADEPIQRRSLLSASKLEAEGLPVEIQVVLGWDMDTRRLLVLLPSDKFIAWTCDLEEVIRSKRVSFGELESLVGRLNHVAYLIPLARHFLHRFRAKLKSKRSKRHILTLSKEDIEDLLLWGDYLLMARQGISMNRLTFRQPSRLGFGDSCPYGLGGYSFHGKAWRLRIPKTSPIFGDCTANNLLEFLALLITLWTIIIECEDSNSTEQCILILGDNTSALGWLYKTRFVEKDSIYYAAANLIARKIARLIIKSTHSIASQHIKGELNIVADLLSFAEDRDDAKPHPLAADGPDDTTLTNRFHSHLSQFIPESFEICPLPDEILSFATLALQTLESSLILNKKRHTKAGTESGDDGSSIAEHWDSEITPSSLVYPPKKENWFPGPSCPSTVELNGTTQETMLESVQKQWLQTLSGMPQAIWLRRFGTVSNQAPFTSKGARGYYNQSDPS